MEQKFDFESRAIELEQAENLISVYLEFVDEECPRTEKYTRDAACAAYTYAERTEMFASILRAAWDTIHKVKEDMNKEVFAI